MRVIAGTARSMPLKSLEGEDTRPTLDRIKETLFNIIQLEVPGSRFLDLFAGTGAIGIEALSRHAKEAVFVDNSRRACGVIRDNLKFTKFTDNSRVMETDCVTAVRKLAGLGKFDIVYIDPPYGRNLEEDVLAQLSVSDIIDEDTLIIVEENLDEELSYAEDLGFEIVRIKSYKTNQHIFLKKRGAEA
ncbi:MAG: 16S rRNA (guanine(966)-N(2))-methyltransferase RsmD [Lachnospiraceae bacterium]|jgi:16S rRNA (guanine966-N2)-methyltransferase|nr:16S rRNA (guanine(966)-N(2))-methyltransferase RsmD [Lachnospiraceae bacterium]MCH4030507.1 16S rRNA (guanine(966)-N(2))-methyltransferase RsmD [Lachnospiraceae bacterium]MCH4069717.1 16S rRNA (guanine(966)-N(2))-methyltransferase RsmD [Lachnospiraceae bacterium]MCH4107345.1 16S rRNA (guanine(966)-N(2))-methyltransferase RsmD [Lachnospiraceae bacterium]MCI1301801.1 16S rRNA (guanine(966)-N(2))-methyltransferase RsmD [Lachnospiraceae bacterium]